MADGLYVGMAGMAARSEQLDSIADNLANVQTPGFKAGRPAFESFLPPGADRNNDKVAPAAVATGIDLSPGAMVNTGNPMDVLPENGAFLAVRMPDASLAYTRNGKLHASDDGLLLAGGHPLVDREGELIRTPPQAKIDVDVNGQVFADGAVVGQIGMAVLSGPLERHGPALLAPAKDGGAAIPTEAKLQRGMIELGNAPAMEAAVQMISAQRHYETSAQALQTYKRLDDRASEVGRVR